MQSFTKGCRAYHTIHLFYWENGIGANLSCQYWLMHAIGNERHYNLLEHTKYEA